MNSMDMIFLILVCLSGGLWETEAMSLKGVSGRTITIKCSHSNAFSNIKYLCKGACTNKDVLISSKNAKTDPNERYSIRDEGNTFFVAISHLTEDDSGTYWCGIERFGVDTYNEVVLTVTKGNTQDPDNLKNEKASSSMKLVYIGAGLGGVVLALVMVLVIFFRHRSRDISASSGKAHDTVYATPFCEKHDADHIAASSSAANETNIRTKSILSPSPAQHQGVSRDNTDDVDSNVTTSSEPQIQPGGLVYSTVSFNKHTGCSTVSAHTAAVTYASLTCLSADESTVYCNV